jgi:TP901 family phage tail tape measure protein
VSLPKAGLELVAENAEKYIGDLNRSTDAAGRFDRSVAQAADGVSKRGSVMQGVFQGVGHAAVDMAVQAGGALLDFAGDSIRAAGDFEGGMNLFAAAAGDMGQEQLGEFKDLFLDLGKELPVSTQEVQDAAIALVRGGIDPAVVEAGALRDSLLFAAAAGMDLEKAAELTVKQLGTFVPVGASVEEQTRFMAESQELLVKAANASTLNVDTLGDAMLTAGGQARAAGLDYDDFVTTMGLISPAFGSAQEAGTSFKNFLVRLQPNTKPAAEAMAELGLLTEDGASKFYDAEGAFIGMEKASQLLQDATQNLTDAERVHYLQTIFGNDAMGAASALAEGGAEAYQQFAAKMADANGVQEQAAATQQGFNFQMENLMGSLEALQITLGTAVLPLLTSFITQYITPGVNAVTDFADAIFATGDPLGTLAEMLGFVQQPSDDLSAALQTIGGTASDAGAAFDSIVAGPMTDLGAMVQDIADKHLLNLQMAWEDDVLPAVQTAQQFFQNDLLPILNDLGAVVLPLLDAALDVAAGFWSDVLVPAIKVTWSFIDGSLIPIVKEITGWMADNLPPAIKTASDFFTETLFPAISEIYDFIDQNVIPILSALADVLSASVGVAVQGLADLWTETLSPALDELVKFVGQHVNPLLEDLDEWLDSVTGGFTGISSAINDAVGWLENLAEKIRNLPDLPDVLTPGSPTPFEIGLRGISDALATTTPRVETFGGSLAGLGTVTPDLQPVMGMSSMQVSVGGDVGVSLSMRGELGRYIDGRVDKRVNVIAGAAARRSRGG